MKFNLASGHRYFGLLLVGSLLILFIYLTSKRTFVRFQHYPFLLMEQRYLLIEVGGGLTNQRLAILYALYHASLYNYTFVKPNLAQCCYPLYHNNRITTISFDTFYTLNTSTSSNLYVDQLPAHLKQECQQQFNRSQTVVDILHNANNRSYYQVQCLKFGAAFFHLSYLLRKQNNLTRDSEYRIGMIFFFDAEAAMRNSKRDVFFWKIIHLWIERWLFHHVHQICIFRYGNTWKYSWNEPFSYDVKSIR